MSAHSACTHGQSPAERRTCREMRHMIQFAEGLGLKVKNTSDRGCAQVTFIAGEDRWYDTRVLWTRAWSRGGYDFRVYWASGDTKRERGKRNMECWLLAISPTPVR